MTATKRNQKPVLQQEAAYLASLSPKVRKLHQLAKPLTGKLTKALHVK